MTAYCDPDDVRLALAGTENSSGTAASLSDPDLQDAIDEAQAEVDGKLAAQHQTPLTSPPELVVSITRDIAAYLATLTYRRGESINATEPVQLRYNRALALLDRAATGQLPLNITPDPEPAAATGRARPTANTYSGSLFGGVAYLREVPTADPEPAATNPSPTYNPAPYGY